MRKAGAGVWIGVFGALAWMAGASRLEAASAPSFTPAAVHEVATRIRAEKDFKGRLRLFEGFRKQVTEKSKELSKSAPRTDDERALHLGVEGLKEALTEIDVRDLSAEGCAASRSRIKVAFSPKEDPPSHLPEQVKGALDLLDALCGGRG